MTDVNAGLRLAPAKLAAKIGELSAEDLLKGISAETRVALAASLAAEAPKPGAGAAADAAPAAPAAAAEESKPEPAAPAAEQSADFKAGTAAANARFATVFASEHAKGREARAAKMLTTSMSADEICGLLADEPKPDANAGDADRTALLAALGGGNADLGNGDADVPDGKANNYGWADIHAEIRGELG